MTFCHGLIIVFIFYLSMTRLSDIKVLLDITDSSSDAKLTLIIAAIESRVEQAT